jgi:monovalent cation:H+ antiporter-2, CPA2 family
MAARSVHGGNLWCKPFEAVCTQGAFRYCSGWSMGHLPFLQDLVIVVLLGVAVTLLGSRVLRLPTAAALLLSGALAGPHAFALVGSTETIEVMAEVGVVLLLFTIGLEFSLTRLRQVARQVVVGGSLQVGLTGLATFGVAMAAGTSVAHAIFYSFIVALSSTAIVLRGLSERGELDSPHGRFIVGALIFQDLCVVPMMLVVPLLAEGAAEGSGAAAIGLALAKAAGVVVLILAVSRIAVPRFFSWVDRTRSREVFLLGVVAVCIGTAWVTSLVGLSLALGAFLGGMVVADTEYGHRAMGDILPLRDIFMSIFFVSMGMLFEPVVMVEAPGLVVLLVLGFVVGKAVLATFAAMAMRFPAKVALVAGIGLAQFGEFGFVLATVADASGVIPREEIREVFNAGLISMFFTPVLVRLAPHVSAGARVLRPLERLLGARGVDEAPDVASAQWTDHVVVVGYGVSGRLLARSLDRLDVSYLVLELNSDTVRDASAEGVPIYYGDVTAAEALEHARVRDARAVVLLINDRRAASRAVATIRSVAPEASILLRTHFFTDVPELMRRGAEDVVVEEVEAGVEMLARVLRRFDVPRNVMEEELEHARDHTHPTDRNMAVPRKRLAALRELDDLKIEKILVRQGDHCAGRSPTELNLRRRTGALVVAVRRNERLMADLDPADPLKTGDILYMVGSKAAIATATEYLVGGPAEPPAVQEALR